MIVTHKRNDCKHKKIPQSTFSTDAQRVLDNLQKVTNKKIIDELAWESKLVQRVSSQILGSDFLITVLIASLDGESATLEKMVDILNSLNHDVRIKAQSLMERLNCSAAPNFFSKIFAEILKNQLDNSLSEVSPELLAGFAKVLMQDSSSIDLNEKLSSFFKGSGDEQAKPLQK